MNTFVRFLENMSRSLSRFSLLPLLTATMDKGTVLAPVIQVTHIIIPSSLQGEKLDQAAISATGFIFSSAHVLLHVFLSGVRAKHQNYSDKAEFYKDKYISLIYWQRPCGSLLPSRTQELSHILMIAGQMILPSKPRVIQRDISTSLLERGKYIYS